MSLTLTPEMLAAAYELLRATPPFRAWKLPAAADVKFKVSQKMCEFAHTNGINDEVTSISCSDRKHGQLNPLLATMAHEMIHVHMHFTDRKSPHHGVRFWRHADRVCRIHGFDRKTF